MAASIELTAEQRQALAGNAPVRAIDPDTNAEYVLVRAELYDRVKSLFADEVEWNQAVHAAAMTAFARDGWDDPRMDVYDALDPRKAP